MIKKKIRAVICGAHGRMGRLLVACAKKDPDIELVGEIDSHGELNSVISHADVVIDFTTASATLGIARAASKRKKALVIGTTGHTDKERNDINKVIRNIPVAWASNFSTGVNVLFYLTGEAAKLLPSFDVEITEIHHTTKKDAPSGTAKRLQAILKSVGRADVPIHALRLGDVVGEHTVMFAAPGERIELTHRASNRDTFALGALRAAKWIVRQKPAFYDMQDVLGLR